MKKIIYILSSTMTDIKENIQIIIFSMLFVFLCFFYISDASFSDNTIVALDGLADTYYLCVENPAISIDEIKKKMEGYGEIHNVRFLVSDCHSQAANCFIYDEYVMEHISYSYLKGERPKHENDVVLSNDFKELYDVGDQITFSVYLEDGSVVTKSKNVCGILKDNTIFYPTGMGSDQMDLLFIEGDNQIYFKKSIITMDHELLLFDDRRMMFLIEPKSDFQQNEVKEMVVDWGDFYSGKQIIADNYAELSRIKSKNRIIVTAGFSVSLSIFLGSIYISFVRRRKEQAVLMLCGGTYLKSSIMLKMNSFCSMLLGAGVGTVLSIFSMKMDYFEGRFNGIHILGVFLLVTMIYLISCILIELCWKKENIIELMKKNI